MYRIIVSSFLMIVLINVNGQDSLGLKKSKRYVDLNIKLIDSPKLKQLKLVEVNGKKFGFSKMNWDSVKKNTTASLVTTENNASDANVPPVVLPSPNSTSLLNLITDNVDLYTGKASLNLPIYNIKCGTISMPISLQSNINAHKVNDIGTWVGLGMNLNAGGMVTRVMKNLPDEFTGTICPAFNIPGWGYTKIKGNGQNIDLSNFDNYSPTDKIYIIEKGNWNKKNNIPDRGWDLQPDEFYFNFGNYSGKFVFDQDGGINLIPQSNLNITPLYQIINGVNKITGFTIITDDGVKYEFGNSAGGNYSLAPVEESKLSVNSSSIQYTYRALAVDQNFALVIGGGIPVSFSSTGYYLYEREPYLIGAVPYFSGNSSGNPSVACCIANFDQTQNNDVTEYFSYPSSWMLKQVTSPNGDFVNFNYSTTPNNLSYLADRSFSSSVPDLAEDYISTSQGNKQIFTSPAYPSWDGIRGIYTLPSKQFFTVTKSTIDLTSRKLLSVNTSDNTVINFNCTTPRVDFPNDTRLDNIVVNNSNNVVLKTINFNYNVVTSSASEFPDEQFKFFYHTSRYWYDNAVPANYIGMHSNLVLPNNLYPYAEEIRGTSGIWTVPAEFRNRMFLTSVQEEANGVMLPAYGFNYNNTKLPFRTSVDQDVYGFANSNPSKHPFIGDGGPNFFISYTYLNPYGGTPTYLSAPRLFPGIFNSPFPILYFKTLNSGNTWTNPLYGGNKTYDLTAIQAGVLNKINYPTGGYKEFVLEFSGNSSGWNGLRVNQTKEYESVTVTPIIKNYAYGTFIRSDGPVVNYNLAENMLLYNNYWLFPTKREFFSSSRVNPETLTKGSVGGYTFAEVSQPNNGKNRVEFFTALDFTDIPSQTKIVSNYTTPPVIVTNFNYPYPPVTSYDWKRGLPKKEISYIATGSMTKYDEYIYPPNPALYGDKYIPSLTVTRYTVIPLSGSGGWHQHLFGVNNSISSWYPPIKKISRIYDQNGINYSESTQEYEYRKYTYNNKDYLLPYQQKDLKNSRNEQTVSYSKYPFDYNSTNINDPFLVAIENLKTKNVFNAKIEQYSYKQDQSGNNKKYIGGILNKYHTDKPLIKEIFKLKTDGLLTTFTESNTNTGWFSFDSHYNSEVNFPIYDANGRILEQNKTNDIKEAYIWDYGKMYPVAKAVNANNNEIAFSSFEADEAGANMTINSASIINDPAGAFTGQKYYSLSYPGAWFPQEPITINLNNNGKEYKLTFWYKEPIQNQTPVVIHYYNGNIETITPFASTIKIRNGWKYSEYLIPASFTGTLTIIKGYSAPPTYIDEVRFSPVRSQMNTYTFAPLIGMTSETDVNGKTVYYEYDALNRLSTVRNEDKNIVKTVCYNYAGQSIPCAVNICAAPVINSISKNHNQVTVNFTAPFNSTNCAIQVTDISTGNSFLVTTGCNSPTTVTVPSQLATYRIVVISYSVDCPAGTQSIPVNI